MEKLAIFIAKADYQATANMAHRLRGSAKMINASELVTICLNLENKARLGDAEGVEEFSAQCRQALIDLEESLSFYFRDES